MKNKTIDSVEFEEKYEPIKDSESDESYQDFWNDEQELKDAHAEHRLWTLVDDDMTGDVLIISGYAFVNRLAYYITKKPFNPDVEITVI